MIRLYMAHAMEVFLHFSRKALEKLSKRNNYNSCAGLQDLL